MISAVSSTCTYPKCLKTTVVGCQGTCSQSYGYEGIIPQTRADLAPDSALFAEVVEALREAKPYLVHEASGSSAAFFALERVNAILAKLEARDG